MFFAKKNFLTNPSLCNPSANFNLQLKSSKDNDRTRCLTENLTIFLSARQAKILTGGIHKVFRGLKFEPNAAIEEIGGFRSRTA